MDASTILTNAGSPDPAIRGAAVAQLDQYQQSDLPNFLLMLVGELADETKPGPSRQMAGIMLKNTVAFKARDEARKAELEERWKQVGADVRSRVKQTILSSLGSTDKNVRLVVALVIANLARIELPYGEWADLITVLTGACSSESDQFVEAALTALGYICEECETSDLLSRTMAQHSRTILQAIFATMDRQSTDVKYFSTNALCNAIDFIHTHMDIESERTYLIQKTLAMAREPHERTRERAMETIVRIASLYYDKLAPHMAELFEATTTAIRQDQESVGLQALLFWIAIGEVEAELNEEDPSKSFKFMATIQQQLFTLLSECLVKQEETQTDEDWNISIAAAKTLAQTADCVGYPVVETVMPFVYSNIQSENWRAREAAIMAFGCVLSGPEPEQIQDTVAQAMPGLFAYMQSGHPLVRDSAAWVMSVIATEFEGCVLEDHNLQKLFEVCGPMLSETPAMAERAASIFHNLCLCYEEEEELPTSELSKPFGGPGQQSLYACLAQGLIGVLDRVDITENLRAVTQETLNALFVATPDDCFETVRSMVPGLVQRLNTLNAQRAQAQGSSATDLELAQGLLCGSINAISRKLGSQLQDYVQPIATAILGVFQSAQGAAQGTDEEVSVLEEALMCVGAVACATRASFVPYLSGFLPYVQQAFSNHIEFDSCSTAIATIGDITAAIKEQMVPHLGDIMNAMVAMLQNNEVDAELKQSMIGCVGDICLNVGPHFQPWLDGTMAIFKQMDETARALPLEENDNQNVVFGFWEAFCGAYTGVLQGFCGSLPHILPHMPQIVGFAQYAAPICRNDESCFAGIVSMLGDVANVVADATPEVIAGAKQVLFAQEVVGIIQEGRRHSSEKVRKSAEWSMGEFEELRQK